MIFYGHAAFSGNLANAPGIVVDLKSPTYSFQLLHEEGRARPRSGCNGSSSFAGG
jgi:hypothetical protein